MQDAAAIAALREHVDRLERERETADLKKAQALEQVHTHSLPRRNGALPPFIIARLIPLHLARALLMNYRCSIS